MLRRVGMFEGTQQQEIKGVGPDRKLGLQVGLRLTDDQPASV